MHLSPLMGAKCALIGGGGGRRGNLRIGKADISERSAQVPSFAVAACLRCSRYSTAVLMHLLVCFMKTVHLYTAAVNSRENDSELFV